MLLSVSLLSSNNVKKFISDINNSKADYIHIDVMDGVFVENSKYTLKEVTEIKELSSKPLDIHLMVENVVANVIVYRTLNPEYLTFHYETTTQVDDMIDLIKNFGIKVGISIKPTTDVKHILPYLHKVDQLLMMAVEPGAGGQDYIDIAEKIHVVSQYVKQKSLKTIISVDGGMNPDTLSKIKNDVQMVVMGSYISNSKNPVQTINELKSRV